MIITYQAGALAAKAPVSALATQRPLPSINGVAVRPGAGFWNWLTGARTAGIGKVWLDGMAKPTLDTSAAQVGAPAAWQAGLTGAGVTVGVLDTGIKADHPDLAGKVLEAQDFTETQAGDDVGHGTHVAGIIAGTGAASNGSRRGVAPDAKLIDGKVCVVQGCAESWIIAGMEWVAPKVRVVNMSLGGGSTDGTDPLSQALNALTAQHGTLFVVSAGNSGTFDPVSTPAAADAALAVGNVTKQDTTAEDSSRGPRAGDFAVKPDIAAPGSDIAAARAKGTPAGDINPVDDNYTRLSGTSMAAPHVAGAAAILAQQNAGWAAERIKTTLMSTTKPTAGVFDQGAGRLDVARAYAQRVTSPSGSLSFGTLLWPHTGPVSKTVTYRNDGSTPITLRLELTDGPFTASAAQVMVPANGTATVDVSANPASRAPGLYGGRLSAIADGISVQTALGVYIEPESYDLAIRFIGRNGPGKFEDATAAVVNSVTGAAYFGNQIPIDATGAGKIRLPKGRYDVHGIDFANGYQDRTVVSQANVHLAGAATTTLDASGSNPVTAMVDAPDAARRFAEVGVASGANDTGLVLTQFSMGAARFFAVPTGAPVTDHRYGFLFGATLSAAPMTSYVYNLAFWERGKIPADTTYRVADSALATVDTRYHAQGATTDWTFRGNFPRYPDFGPGSFQFLGYEQATPGRRTEFYTANPDITWTGLYLTSTQDSSDVETHRSIRAYRPGHQAAAWNRAPLGPAFGSPVHRWGVVRDGTDLRADVTLFSGSDLNQYIQPADGVTGTTTLSRDGKVIGTSSRPGSGVFALPDSPGTYTLRSVAQRSVPWSVIGTKADVSWTFREPGAAAPVKPLRLFVIRAAGDVDDNGRAPAGRVFPLTLTAQTQPGAPAVLLTELKVEASFDDGATWSRAETYFGGDKGAALVHHPAGKGFVSLRITARDAAGSSVAQTITKAYQIS